MATEEIAVAPNDEGVSPCAAVPTDAPGEPPIKHAVSEYAQLPPELRPDEKGNFPTLTPKLLKRLRARYFTVKHIRLTNCGHLMDQINQPKNNCENCWFQFFNTHPQLVETTDQFFRTQGKGPLVGMRGEVYFKNFVRYMATVIHFMKEEEALKVKEAEERKHESTNQSNNPGTIEPSTESNQAGQIADSFTSIA